MANPLEVEDRTPSFIERLFQVPHGFEGTTASLPCVDDIPPTDRKRLFVAIWDALSEADRRQFLSRVDPNGVFVRGAS